MVIRKIKEKHWEHVYRQITTYGRNTPLSLQLDIDVNCNGVDYVLKVQPDKGRKIVALQAYGLLRVPGFPVMKLGGKYLISATALDSWILNNTGKTIIK